jgi:hypothetical protein
MIVKMKRKEFVKYWADFVKKNPDEEWSRQQNIVINSQLNNSKLTRKQYMKIKGENFFD